jgi:Beta-propeller repeat
MNAGKNQLALTRAAYGYRGAAKGKFLSVLHLGSFPRLIANLSRASRWPMALLAWLAALTLTDSQNSVLAAAGGKGPAQFVWVKQAGSTNTDTAFSLAVDGAGKVFVTGYFESTASFGNTNLTSSGYDDLFIAKYDSRGNFLWVRQGGGPTMPPPGTSGDVGYGIAADAAGNAYVTGDFQGTASFSGTNLISAGINDIFVAKYDGGGKLLWIRRAGGALADTGLHIAADNAGNCYATGFFRSTSSFGSFNLTVSGSGTADMFVTKYDADGNVLWAKQGGGTGNDVGYAVGVDSSGNVFVVGYFSGTATFAGASLTSYGSTDIFVAKYDAVGNLQWIRQAGSTGSDIAQGVALDSSGNCYVTGFFSGAATFGSTVLTNAGGRDIFVAKYDGAGNLLWARRAGGSATDSGDKVAVYGVDEVYVLGQFTGTASFGNTDLVNSDTNGLAATFLAKYDSAGNFLWAMQAGSPGTGDLGKDLAVAGRGVIYLAGGFSATSHFGLLNVTSYGSSDAYLAKLVNPPELGIGRSGGNVVLSWPASPPDFFPQFSAALSTSAVWNDIATNLVVIGATTNTLSLPAPTRQNFYRLRQQ